jgi:hypothetical protein
MKAKLILFALYVFAPLMAHAETTVWPNLKMDVCGSYKVLHINGVDTNQDGARANLGALAAAYGNAHDKHTITYGLGYNQTNKLGMDILQAIDQSLKESPATDSYADWVRAWVYGIFPSWFPQATMTYIISTLGQKLNWRKPDAYFDNDTASILNDARNYGFTGLYSRLLIVGHSQGTIFANILARRLILPPNAYLTKHQVGLMSIAAFVPTLEGTGSQWVTNANDWPVAYGRAVYADIKGNTVTIPHTEPETYAWRGHNLITKYLADPTSKQQIIDKMKLVMDGLTSDPITPATVKPYPGMIYTNVMWWDCSVAHPCSRTVGNNPISVVFTTPIIFHGVINSPPNAVTKPGTMEDAIRVGTANAGICYQLILAKEIQLKLAFNLSTGGYAVYGCLVYPNYMSYTGIWHAYSGDLPPTFQATYYPSAGQVAMYHAATCRRPAAI